MSTEKIKAATGCLGGCSGCHMSFLDVDKWLIDLVEEVQIVASHMIVDTKEIPQVELGIVEGAVTNQENLELLETIRSKSDILVAWGDCACLGGIMTMRNFMDIDDVLKETYQGQADEDSEVPDPSSVPGMLDKVHPIDHYVDAEVYLPGCPPSAELIRYSLEELVEGRIPELSSEQLTYN